MVAVADGRGCSKGFADCSILLRRMALNRHKLGCSAGLISDNPCRLAKRKGPKVGLPTFPASWNLQTVQTLSILLL